MIVFVGAVVIGATGAFFSDTETSTGNTFTAGAIDLKIDNESYYNGVLNPETTWRIDYDLSDENGHQFFNFEDLKPGDWGEDTISLHINNNDAWLRMIIKDVTDFDNSCTEPEEGSVDTCTVSSPELLTPGAGELREALLFSVWLDQGLTPGFQGKYNQTNPLGDPGEGDNIRNHNEPTIISSGTIDADGGTWNLADAGGLYLIGGQTAYFGIDWTLPGTTVNETQTDSMSATMEFQVVQHRNNPTQLGF